MDKDIRLEFEQINATLETIKVALYSIFTIVFVILVAHIGSYIGALLYSISS